jgi:hypothetical protein
MMQDTAGWPLGDSIDEGDHTLGNGLLLRVRGQSLCFVFRYTAFDGRRREMGMGKLMEGGSEIRGAQLAKVRALVVEQRGLIARGIDPIDHRDEQKRQSKVARLTQRGMTVRRVMRLWMDYTEPRRKWSTKYAMDVAREIENDPPAWIMELPAAELRSCDVIRALGQMTCCQERIDTFRQRLDWALEWFISQQALPANAGGVRRNVRGRFAEA